MSENSRKFADKIGVYVAPGGQASIATQIIQGQEKLTPPKHIPYKGVNTFVGREEEMILLHSKLQHNNAVAVSAIAGMGGVGKTELATQYARQHEADYPGGICWLNARDTNLAADIIQFYQFYVDNKREIPQELGGRQLTVSEQAIWCWENWQAPEGFVLVVWDDVTDLGSCQQLLPKNNRFRLLVTTRLRNLDPNLVEEIPLDVLSLEKSIELLKALIGKKRIEKEPETAAELCKWLGYLPLGLELVGRYVADDPDLSLLQMLESLQQQRLDDEALERSTETWTTAQRGVLAAFELSWQKLDAKTQQVAELLSLFAPDVIPWKLIQSTCERLDWSKTEIKKAKKQLYKHYLLQHLENRESSYKIHPLIRQFLQAKLNLTSSALELKQAFTKEMLSIARTIPDTPTISDIESVSDAIPHIKEVAENMIAVVENEDLFWVFTGIALFYKGQGLYVLAEPWHQQCVSLLKNCLGEEHPLVAVSYSNLAAVYFSQGRYKDTENLQKKALELSLLAEEHTLVASIYNNLARLYSAQGKYTEAEPLCKKALELRQLLLGEEDPHVASSYNNLALLYFSQGRYTEAEPLYKKALEIWQQLLGEDHPNVAQSYNNLAGLYLEQGRYTETELMYKKALKLRQQLLGEEHPDVAQSYNNLAFLYSKQKQYKEAEILFKKALKLRQQLLGEENPDVAQSYNNLAFLYSKQKQYIEAEILYKKALELWQRLPGQEHPDLAIIYENLAGFYKSQERYTDAEPLYKKVLELRQRLLGEENPDVATSYNNLAALYESQERYTDAEPLYKKVLELRQRLLGEEHPDVATSYNNLAGIYFEQERYTEAEPLYKKALELRQRLLGEEHPDVMTSYNNLALLYFSQGRYKEAEPLYKKVGEEHPSVTNSYNNLALFYFSQGRYTEAKQLLKKALVICEQQLGTEHPHTITVRKNLEDFRNIIG